jgi:putative aldouronate transport system permease protein
MFFSIPKIKQPVKNVDLYFFLLPMLVYLVLFNYAPMYGLQIAFKDFIASLGITGSPWVGFKHFVRFLRSPLFWSLFRNTLSISLYQLVVSFPMPILLALVLQYAAFRSLAKITQTITYAPHFISIVVMVGMLFVFFDPSNGPLTLLLKKFEINSTAILTDPKIFRHLYVWSGVWQNTGWASVIYIAALSNSDPELHQAAIVDGANLVQRVLFIDIPVLFPTAIILLILNCGNVMNLGFEKVYLMQTSPNLSVSEVISTYVYKIGLQGQQYSYASAIGLFNNIINFMILLTVNAVAKKSTEESLW